VKDDADDAREVAALAAAVQDMARAQNQGEAEAALQGMPLSAVLFFALMGTPGERAEIDPPFVLALRAVRATLDGWAHARGESAMFAAVPFADLDLLARRVDATIELARRGAVAGGA
jgi:hypothetical protein